MPEDDLKGNRGTLIRFIQANMCLISLSLLLNKTSGLQSPSSALLIGHQSSPRWGLNFNIYPINNKSLAKAQGGCRRGCTRKALDPTMIVLKWHWHLPLLVSSHPFGYETITLQPASGHPGEDETFSRLTLKNEWTHLVFVRGFGVAILKAAPIRLPAVLGVRRCNNCPLEKRKRKEKGLFILLVLHRIHHTLWKRKCDQKEHFRVRKGLL